jgi:hypothetical protein
MFASLFGMLMAKSALIATACTLHDRLLDMAESNQKQREKEYNTDLVIISRVEKLGRERARAIDKLHKDCNDMIREVSSNRKMRANKECKEMHEVTASLTPHKTLGNRRLVFNKEEEDFYEDEGVEKEGVEEAS